MQGLDQWTTARLLMRPLTNADAKALFTIGNDYNIARNVAALPWPFELPHAHALIRKADRQRRDQTAYGYGVCLTQTPGRLIGYGKVSACGTDQKARCFELSYWIGARFQGCGYATELARGLVTLALDRLQADRIIAWHGLDNPASRHIQEKLGMTFYGQYGMVFSQGRGMLVPCRQLELNRPAQIRP